MGRSQSLANAGIFYLAVTLLALCPIEANLRMISGAWYLAFGGIVAYSRYCVRFFLNIEHGDFLTDACIGVLFYPLALVQAAAPKSPVRGDVPRPASAEYPRRGVLAPPPRNIRVADVAESRLCLPLRPEVSTPRL